MINNGAALLPWFPNYRVPGAARVPGRSGSLPAPSLRRATCRCAAPDGGTPKRTLVHERSETWLAGLHDAGFDATAAYAPDGHSYAVIARLATDRT